MNTPTKEKIIELALKAGFGIDQFSPVLVRHSNGSWSWVGVEEKLIEFARLVVAEGAPKPDADGWIDWNGGECPVPDGAWVEVRFRDGACHEDQAGGFGWTHENTLYDIVAYRVIEGGAT